MANGGGRNVRLVQYPKALSSCALEAAKYASCVSRKDDVKRDDCKTEFIKLKNCFQKAVKDLVTKKS